MSNENEHFETEPIHIQDALNEELDRLEAASQKHYDAKHAEQDEVAKRSPELYEIEQEMAKLRLKDELTDQEVARLAELRVHYDRLILDRDLDT